MEVLSASRRALSFGDCAQLISPRTAGSRSTGEKRCNRWNLRDEKPNLKRRKTTAAPDSAGVSWSLLTNPSRVFRRRSQDRAQAINCGMNSLHSPLIRCITVRSQTSRRIGTAGAWRPTFNSTNVTSSQFFPSTRYFR